MKRKAITLVFALYALAAATKASASVDITAPQPISYRADATCTGITITTDSVWMSSPTSVVLFFTVGLPANDWTTNLACIAAQLPAYTPFDDVENDLQQAVGGTTGGYTAYAVTMNGLTPGISEALTVFGTDYLNSAEIAPWDNERDVTMLPNATVTVTMQKNNVNVYPNPSNGNFTIQNSEYQKFASYKIFDLQGKEVSSIRPTGEKTSVVKMPEGTYTLSAGDFTGKIIVR